MSVARSLQITGLVLVAISLAGMWVYNRILKADTDEEAGEWIFTAWLIGLSIFISWAVYVSLGKASQMMLAMQ